MRAARIDEHRLCSAVSGVIDQGRSVRVVDDELPGTVVLFPIGEDGIRLVEIHQPIEVSCAEQCFERLAGLAGLVCADFRILSFRPS